MVGLICTVSKRLTQALQLVVQGRMRVLPLRHKHQSTMVAPHFKVRVLIPQLNH